MAILETNEKRFESDIEAAFLSPEGGSAKGQDEYDPKLGLYQDTLIRFIQDSKMSMKMSTEVSTRTLTGS